MQLLDPRFPSVFNRRIQKDDLILDPYLVYDGFQSQVPLRCLRFQVSLAINGKAETTYLLVFRFLVSTPFVCNVAECTHVSSSVAVVCPVKLRAPDLDDVDQTSQKDILYSLV
jgi:hypothetical protein